MTKRALAHNVMDAALGRLLELYQGPYYPVVSFSAGKDSGVCLELAIEAATMTDRLPVQVSMRDEEIMFPGTFEYAERVAARPEVEMHWWVANQPIVNTYNRHQPYFWVFDPILSPEQWVRQPPAIAKHLDCLNIQGLVTREAFPQAPPDQEIITIVGLRTSESPRRQLGLFRSGGYLTKSVPMVGGTRYARPIYDWGDGDIWKAIHDNAWDYNSAYDTMHRLGVSRSKLRIAPPTMSTAGADHLKVAAQAWPRWFDRLCQRCPGVRQVAMFGKRAAQPTRRYGETWEQTFQRECIDEAPDWIADRSRSYLAALLKHHRLHSTSPLPERVTCPRCGQVASYRQLAMALYNGDPFISKLHSWGGLKPIEPEFFRPGSGVWNGSPTF
jgi:predicted phosphoadenosine phosphosulfate sulfurtransferase